MSCHHTETFSTSKKDQFALIVLESFPILGLVGSTTRRVFVLITGRTRQGSDLQFVSISTIHLLQEMMVQLKDQDELPPPYV